MGVRPRIVHLVSLAPLLGALGAAPGCTAVLGMEAPGLADGAPLVADGGTVTELPPSKSGEDAGSFDAPAAALDSAAPSIGDAAGEDSADPLLGVPCGSTACSGATPICCMSSNGDAGGAAFQCVTPADTCTPGYSVECDSEHSCPGSGQGCCHYAHATKCVSLDPATQACPGGGAVRVCDPTVPGMCGAGLSCKVVTSGSASPYYACE
jgi:hypothetical protein